MACTNIAHTSLPLRLATDDSDRLTSLHARLQELTQICVIAGAHLWNSLVTDLILI